MGNNLVYADTYPQALAELTGENLPEAPVAGAEQKPVAPAAPAVTAAAPDSRIAEIRRHLQRYRELVSLGKLSEAGKELEAVQSLVEK
jgi:hypothetical protein